MQIEFCILIKKLLQPTYYSFERKQAKLLEIIQKNISYLFLLLGCPICFIFWSADRLTKRLSHLRQRMLVRIVKVFFRLMFWDCLSYNSQTLGDLILSWNVLKTLFLPRQQNFNLQKLCRLCYHYVHFIKKL